LYIIIIIIILLIIRVIKVNFEIYEWQHIISSGATSLSKRVTGSGVFVNTPLTVASLVSVDVDPTVMDRDQDEQEQTCHCQ
jgi:isoprenylcysteine carboxyl methyltransferase (ICMT) family protein YpbQ